MVYVILMFCIGLMMGGFAGGNNTIGIVGLISFVVIILIALIINYIRQRDIISVEVDGYISKLERIKNGNSAFFSPAEIVSHIVNLWEAKQKLNNKEFYYVNLIYDAYKLVNKEECLDFFGFLCQCDRIIAHFDLVAPYYKFCGSDNLQNAVFIDYLKIPYREKAKKLLNKELIFEDEWMKLHKEFMTEFYS